MTKNTHNVLSCLATMVGTVPLMTVIAVDMTLSDACNSGVFGRTPNGPCRLPISWHMVVLSMLILGLTTNIWLYKNASGLISSRAGNPESPPIASPFC